MARSDSEAEVAVDDVLGIEKELESFLEPYLDLFPRREQREHAALYVTGRLQELPRRTTEPIATERGKKRRPLQHFVGAGKWDDEALRAKLCRHVAKEIGTADGVLILDGSGFQKSGPESVGTQRQWCGRIGKEEQCQVGEFLVYASDGSVALVDCELYLPKSWANDKARRAKCHVPKDVIFKTGWQLAAEMVYERGRVLPHRWVVGDETYGRPTELRDQFFAKDEQYVLEVHCDAKVRLARGGDWTRADEWADSLPERAWQSFTTRDGEKGPIHVRAAKVRVYTPRASGKGTERPEVLVVVRNDRDSKSWTYLASDTQTGLKELVRVGACRHGIEQALNMGKGDVGLDEYELRSWVGWHHHMTLSLVSLWFLVCEQRRIKKLLQQSPSLRSAVSLLLRPSSPAPVRKSPRSSARSSAGTRKPAANTGDDDNGGHHRSYKHVRPSSENADDLSLGELAQSN